MSAGFGKKPVRLTGFPSLNKTSVGIAITSNLCANSPSASTSTLTIFTFEPNSSCTSFSIGAIILQGPHQSA